MNTTPAESSARPQGERQWLRLAAALAALIGALAIAGGWVYVATGAAYGFVAYGFGADDSGSERAYVINTATSGAQSIAGLSDGTRILAVDGIAAEARDGFRDTLWRPRRAGETVRFRVERPAGASGPSEVAVETYRPASLPDLAATLVGVTIYGVSALAVAVFVAIARPREPAAVALLILGTDAALYAAVNLWLAVPNPYGLWGVRALFVTSCLQFVSMLHFFLAVPTRHGWLQWIDRWPLVGRTLGGVRLIYGVTALLALAVMPGPVAGYAVLLLVGMLMLVVGIAAAVRTYRKPPTPLARAQIKWLLWAAIVSTSVSIAYVVPYSLAPGTLPPMAAAAVFAAGSLIPASFGLAVLRYRLFDVDRVVQQSLVYAVLTALLVSAYLAITFTLSQAAGTLAGDGAESGRGASVLAALVLAVVAAPVRRRLQAGIDRLIYRARVIRREFLQQAGEFLSRAQPLDELHGFLTATTADRLRLSGAWLAVPTLQALAVDGGAGSSPPVGPLLARLASASGPVVLAREDLSASAVTTLPADDPALAPWFDAGARLLVPLRASALAGRAPAAVGEPGNAAELGTPIGVWALGGLSSGGLPDREDLRAVDRVSRQAALLLDHARLNEQEVHQALVAQDLARAREIQQQLLPPMTGGWPGRLDIAARLLPARETSGDFYDVFSVFDDDGSHNGAPSPSALQIAVGDVQGKGMGAALVMALAQATLRTAAHECSSMPVAPGIGGHAPGSLAADQPRRIAAPSTTLALTGNLLHRSVGRRNFVACSLAVAEPLEAGRVRLTVANAGQVRPLLCRAGEATELVPAGNSFPLAVELKPVYGELTQELEPGDTVIFASDGLPEAPVRDDLLLALPAAIDAQRQAQANDVSRDRVTATHALTPPSASGELFGFERLAQSAAFWAREAATAEGVLDGIWSDVLTWTGEASHHDDMTLVVMRVPR